MTAIYYDISEATIDKFAREARAELDVPPRPGFDARPYVWGTVKDIKGRPVTLCMTVAEVRRRYP